MQMERFWYNIATYMINLYVDRVLFSLTEFVSVNLVGRCREYIKETCNVLNEFEETEVDHVGPSVGHNFAPKYCCLKLVGVLKN